jgi:hypothetical protein
MCLEKRIGRWGLRRAHLKGEKPVSSPWFSSKDLLRSSNRVSVDVDTKASGSGLIDGAPKKRIAQITLVPWHSERTSGGAVAAVSARIQRRGFRGVGKTLQDAPTFGREGSRGPINGALRESKNPRRLSAGGR